MLRTYLFPSPERLSGIEALLLLCRLRAMLAGTLPWPQLPAPGER